MVVHVVMIRFREEEGEEEAVLRAAEMIEALVLKVPSLRSMETGINFSPEERAMDLCLIAHFDDREGLQEYAVHPEHQKVIAYIKEKAEYSKVVDYEKA